MDQIVKSPFYLSPFRVQYAPTISLACSSDDFWKLPKHQQEEVKYWFKVSDRYYGVLIEFDDTILEFLKYVGK